MLSVKEIWFRKKCLRYIYSQEIMEAFGEYFWRLYKDSNSFSVDTTTPSPYNIPSCEHSLEIIISAIFKLNHKFTSGTDQIPSFLVKDYRLIFL